MLWHSGRSYPTWEAAMRAQTARIGLPGSPAQHHKPTHGGYPDNAQPHGEVSPLVRSLEIEAVREAEAICRDAAE